MLNYQRVGFFMVFFFLRSHNAKKRLELNLTIDRTFTDSFCRQIAGSRRVGFWGSGQIVKAQAIVMWPQTQE